MSYVDRRSALIAGAAALAAPLLPTGRAQAAAPQATKQMPGVYRYKVGDFEVTVVTDGTRPVPLPDTLVKNASKEQVANALEAAFLPRDTFPYYFNPIVVNTGSKLIAMDTGNGPAAYASSKGALGQYHTNLAAAGIDTASIDTVVISHFHGDHIGGLVTAEGKPAFANAEIMVPAKEWAFWTDEGNASRAPDSLKPAFANVKRIFDALGRKVTQYESDKEVVPGIQAFATYGHTPGHTSHIISSAGKSVVAQADVTNLPQLFVRNPGWHASFDMDGAMAEEARRKLYDRLVADRMMVQAFHFSFPAAAYIEKDGNGYRYTPVTWQPVI